MKNSTSQPNLSPNFWNQLSNILPWLLFAFYFFVFPSLQDQILPVIQNWMNSLGIWAPIGYITTGVLATVVAPIGLWPINVILQRAFGFWPSVFYFWTFEVVGMSINFLLSCHFGNKFLHLFFAGIVTKDKNGNFNDPITKFSSYMLDKSWWNAFAIMLGMGKRTFGVFGRT